MKAENFTVKKTYVAGHYARQLVTFLVMVGATGEPPIYIERRGYARFKKVVDAARAQIPKNKARYTCHPAIRAGKYFVDLEIDGLDTEVEEFKTVLNDTIDIIDSTEDWSAAKDVPRIDRIQSVKGQLELPPAYSRVSVQSIRQSLQASVEPVRDCEPVRFVIKDA
jgi:hypothetical protein